MEAVTVPTRLGRKTITADNIADGVVPSTDPKDSGATGSTSSTTAPTEFATITAATYSAKNITGSADWVEVTTATDHGYSKGDKVTIYGLNNNLVNADGTFLVTESVSNTVFRYSPSLNGFYTSAVNLTTSFTVTQRSRTTAVATLKLSTAAHGLIAGSVITVTDVPDQTDYNGTFFIASVSGDTITYKFESELSTSEAITSSAGTVHAVTHKYAIIGDTWIDTSVTPNTYKVWNGLKWTDSSNIPDGVIIDDHMAPAAPTGLSATQNGYYDSSSGSPKIAIDLKWSAPTTNADGSTLRDLAGYKVYYKYTKGVDSTGNAGSGVADTTTTNTDGTLTGTFSYHPNIAQSPATVTFSTSAGTIQPTSITVDGKTSGNVAWTISGLSDSQEVAMTWSTPSSGYGDITGTAGSTNVVSQHNNAASSFSYDIFGNTAITASTQPTAVDPVAGGASTAITSWQDGPDVPSTTNPSVVIKDFNTSSEIQFAVKAYDSSKKNYSVMSDPLTVVTGTPALVLNPPSKPTVSVRLGTATVEWDGKDNSGLNPPPSLQSIEVHIGSTSTFTPNDSTYKDSILYTNGTTSGYVVIDGLTYNSKWYAKLVAVSTNQVKTNPSAASDQFTIVPLVNTDLIANTLSTWPFIGGVVNAAALADGAVSARTLAQNAINSSNIANVITPGAISTGLIAANAIGADQIAAGSIVAGKLAANAVTATTIAANAITAGKIDANAITADKILAGSIDATKLSADYVYTKSLSASQINAGTLSANYISGGTISASDFQTSNWSDGSGVKISTNTNSITFNKNGSAAGFILPFSPSAGFNGGVLLHGGASPDTTGATTPLIAVGQNNAAGINIMANNSEFGVSAASAWLTSSGDTVVGARFGTGNNVYVSASNTYIGSQQFGGATNVYIGLAGTTSNIFANTATFTTNTTSATINGSSIASLVVSGSRLDVQASNGSNVNTPGGVSIIGNSSLGTVSDYTYSPAIYTTTTSQAANMYVATSANGYRLYRSTATSSRELKRDIRDLNFNSNDYLSISPVVFKYKEGVVEPEELDDDVVGFIAEDFIAKGLDQFLVNYPSEQEKAAGDHIGLRYDRMYMFLHKIVAEQDARIKYLESLLINNQGK